MRSPTFLTLLSTHTTLEGGPRQTLGKLTNTLPLYGLLARESHRHLHYCAYEAVSHFGECGLPCGLRGALCTLHLCRSVSTSFTDATRGTGGWVDLTWQGLAPCKKRQASLGALTPAVSRADSRSEARAKAVGVGSSAWFGAGSAPGPRPGTPPRWYVPPSPFGHAMHV